MKTKFKLAALVACVLFSAGLYGLNVFITLWLLGLTPEDNKAIATFSIARPLVLSTSDPEAEVNAKKLLLDLGVSPVEVSKLPRSHPWLVDISLIQTLNPYPPLLSETHPSYRRLSNFFSFGYLGRDGKYYQVTRYSGEADTTPSLLVKKVRGPETFYGDYFVSYTFSLSRETRKQPLIVGKDGRVLSWREPSFTLDRIQWRTYRGGSYDGLEEMMLPPLATLAEIIVGSVVILLLRAYRGCALNVGADTAPTLTGDTKS